LKEVKYNTCLKGTLRFEEWWWPSGNTLAERGLKKVCDAHKRLTNAILNQQIKLTKKFKKEKDFKKYLF
jgi:N-glycosylase/DNA lyase